ncbi:MAG: hypothetical protein K2N51_15670 [Lachnospiraceae bacterium]|nr:hypothetical protein [Lachnospiraceae bacterium]
MNKLETTLSILAIIISILSIIISFIQNRKMNNVNIKAHYFEKIFDEYMISQIPKARKYIRFSNGKLSDFEELGNVLNRMIANAIFFKFDNIKFYKELKICVQNLEDYMYECSTKTYEDEEQSNIYKEIQIHLEKIYHCINKYYSGKKS